MIFTFYSYKGGVGRSMALANIAQVFYESGLRVAMVDWDLESPGLENFFWDEPPKKVLEAKGIMELIQNYKKQLSTGFSIPNNIKELGQIPFENLSKYLIDLYPEAQNPGKLWLLTAGNRSGKNLEIYSHKVRNFNWKDFYDNWAGEVYIEWLRIQLSQIADIILIDSRTGLSETAGICTYQLADTVVMFCSPDIANNRGTDELAKRLKDPKLLKIRANRPINIMALPSRVNQNQQELLQEFRVDFLKRFTGLIPKNNSISIEDLWNLGIPNTLKIAYHEKVTTRINNRETESNLKPVYFRISKYMNRYELVNFLPEQAFIPKTRTPFLITITSDRNYIEYKVIEGLRNREYSIETHLIPPSFSLRTNKYYYQRLVERALASQTDKIFRCDSFSQNIIKRIYPETISIYLLSLDPPTDSKSYGHKIPKTYITQKYINESKKQLAQRLVGFDYLVSYRRNYYDDSVSRIMEIVENEHQHVNPTRENSSKTLLLG